MAHVIALMGEQSGSNYPYYCPPPPPGVADRGLVISTVRPSVCPCIRVCASETLGDYIVNTMNY